MHPQTLSRLAVIGAGQMGAGIAHVAAAHGIRVQLCDTTLDRAQAGVAAVTKQWDRLVQKSKLTAEQHARMSGLLAANELEAAVAGAELVVEAATENRAIKLELFRKLDAVAPPEAILASNTSSLSITALAAVTRRPTRVVGLHFMNPVPLMKLVEIVRGLETDEATVQRMRALAERLGKTVIVSTDSPGFLVNRILIPLLLEACFALQEGVGTAEDIDQGARLGLNHPLGPLELSDLIGLDTVLAISEVLQGEIGDDKYRAPTLLRNLVAAGWYGRKAGRGFYRYDASGKKLAAEGAST
ncbi:MAG TPA: 3-hydroxyacyl-CoA dehydrogenase NAD-binding domain-containing protein [Polyangiaceae bacterium]|nr:3-hydroxyacyl-CoA dehydrogenase NAD-binding domain-containing protein [Polyangiaceae bacterium]